MKEHDPELPFIVVSGSIGEENAVSLMRAGVSDFIFKGNLSRLIPAIHRELAAAAQQHARREADQRFRDIVEVSGDWIWETDAEHRYTFLSNRFEEAEWADPRDEPSERRRGSSIGADPDEDEHWQAHLSDRQGHRTFRNFLFSVTAPTGSRHHISMSGMPVFDRTGAFRGYRGTATDETRMVEAFWRAGEAETLLRDAVESISEGFLILDRDDHILMANDALRKLYPDVADMFAPGVPYEEVLRTAIERNVYPDAKGREADWLTTRLEDHRDLSGGIIEKLSDGRWVMCTERRMSNGGIAGLKMDITALKKAEAQRDHLAYHDSSPACRTRRSSPTGSPRRSAASRAQAARWPSSAWSSHRSTTSATASGSRPETRRSARSVSGSKTRSHWARRWRISAPASSSSSASRSKTTRPR